MGLPVDVAGLNTIVPTVDDGCLLLVEGGADLAKSFFVRRLVLSAGRVGRHVTFLTSRERGELEVHLAREGGHNGGTPEWLEWLDIREMDRIISEESLQIPDGGLLAIDSFSFLALPLTPEAMASFLRRLRQECRARGTPVVLAIERGMLEARSEAVAVHLADGLIQFHAQEGVEGIIRFLRIPKWTDGRFVDRNVYYEFDGRQIAIDLRKRIL